MNAMERKQRILVTGASGFLGKKLVDRLLRIVDAEVKAVCHLNESCHAFPGHPRLVTDAVHLEDQDGLRLLLSEWKPDIIFHLGAVARLHAGQDNPEKTAAVNLLGSINLLQLAARHGAKKFLFTSSDLAREAKSVVGITKLLMEKYLQLYPGQKPDVVSFRMPNLYNFPGSVMDIFSRQIAEDKNLSITDERMARRFLTRREAADYLLFLMKNGRSHQVYSVKQEPLLIKDLAEKMIAKSGKNLKLNIIGARPGEMLRQASYSDAEAENMSYNNLARLRLSSPTQEEIGSLIQRLSVSEAIKVILQNKFNTFLPLNDFSKK
jgi:FlaA1/EpsC-like NDP-sugar epimerase